MTTMEQLNALPVPTWNHLGVNAAPASAALPPVPDGGWGETNTKYDPLPAGAACRPTIPRACVNLVSGLGEQADRAIRTQANFARFFAAEGKLEAPILLRETLDARGPNAVTHTALHAKAGSDVTFVQLAQGAGTSAALTQIAAERDAHVKLVQVQLLTPASRRWNGVAIRCATGARVEVVRIELGAGIVVAGARAALASRGGEFDLDAVYYGGGDAVLDFNDVSVHTARDTTSELHTAGVLADRAQKVLRGTIDFRRGAVRGVGHESEDVLLFSPAVRNRTTPLILCTEEQVEGQHAATIGRLDEGMLYYLASRGLDPEEAKRLMVDARFAPAIDKLPDDALQAAVRAEIGRRLDHHA